MMLSSDYGAGAANTNAPKVDRPMSQLEEHANQLDSLVGGLEEVLSQYESILGRLRGPQPIAEPDGKVPSAPESLMTRIAHATDRLHVIRNVLGERADALAELV